jgi:PUA-domain protein
MASKTSQRHFLKEKEAKQIILEFSGSVNVNTERLLESKPRIEFVETQTAEVFIINRKPVLMRLSGRLLPTLFFDEVFPILPKVIVNMGAVPYICNGADVMAPGVVRVDGDFKKNDILLVVDERFGRSLAIGVALSDSQTMRKLGHGKFVKNFHYVGDKLWNSLKEKFDII